MPLQPPVLDDRTFDDLVEEVRSRIPRYTPEWTNFNDSDPGMTLAQLFSWMSEMILYRLNQVPELHYLKFLELLDVDRRPASPAQADLTFTVLKDEPYALVPARARVGVSGSDPPVVFEVLEGFTALGGSLADIQVEDAGTFAGVKAENDTAGKSFAPLGRRAIPDNALYLGFQTPQVFPTQEVSLMVYLKESETEGGSLRCSSDGIDLVLPVRLAWEYRAQFEWKPLKLERDETRVFTQSGLVRFLGPKDIVPAAVGRPPDPTKPAPLRYWIRCRLVDGGYEVPPQVDQILLNTVRAESAQTLHEEVLGSSSGTTGQVFTLRNIPVIDRSVELEVDEGRGFEQWEQKPDLFGSGRDDPHYVLHAGRGEIRFGNGRRGRIPRAGQNNIKAKLYRYGGGANANTGAETITDVQTFIRGIDTVTNHRPAAGGADEEPVQETKLRGPRMLRVRGRAVTAEDFEELAKEAPGARVRRAKALPLRHPSFPGTVVPGAVTVIVVPEWPSDQVGPPMPTQATLANVCRYLDRFRLITSELHVIGPTYVSLQLTIPVFVRRASDPSQVRTAVEKALRRFFDPLVGGEPEPGQTEGPGWPFGGAIFFSNVYRAALHVEGVNVERVGTPVFTVDRVEQPECQDVPIPEGALVHLRKVDVQVRFIEAEA